jgi:hypothetical protein
LCKPVLNIAFVYDELESEIDLLQSRNEELVAENSKSLGLIQANNAGIKQLVAMLLPVNIR